MDARSKNLSRNTLDAKKFELSPKTKVGKKGKTLCFVRKNNVHSGTRQSNVHMFDHLKSTNYFEGATLRNGKKTFCCKY
jgi:hypothetical protein